MRKVQATLQRHLLLLRLVPRHPTAVTARPLVEQVHYGIALANIPAFAAQVAKIDPWVIEQPGI